MNTPWPSLYSIVFLIWKISLISCDALLLISPCSLLLCSPLLVGDGNRQCSKPCQTSYMRTISDATWKWPFFGWCVKQKPLYLKHKAHSQVCDVVSLTFGSNFIIYYGEILPSKWCTTISKSSPLLNCCMMQLQLFRDIQSQNAFILLTKEQFFFFPNL